MVEELSLFHDHIHQYFLLMVLLNLFLPLAGTDDMLANNTQSTVQFYVFCSLCSKMKFQMLVHVLYAVHHLEKKMHYSILNFQY